MKPIVRHRVFEKHFSTRIAFSPKLIKQFTQRLYMFNEGVRGYPLNDHHLKGGKYPYRAFSIANDIRVIYYETDDYYVFLDIGSHNQVY